MPSGQYKQEEERIAVAAIVAIRHSKPNLAEIARHFGVSYGRLRYRYQGNDSRITRKPTRNKRLTEQQERELLDRISRLGNGSIEQIANQILARDYTGDNPPPTVTPRWRQRFINRHGLQPKGEVNFPLSIEEMATKSRQISVRWRFSSAQPADSTPLPTLPEPQQCFTHKDNTERRCDERSPTGSTGIGATA